MTFRIASARIPPPQPKPPIANAFLIELVSAAILCYTTIVTWTEADHVPPDNWAIEFCASVATLCVLMCIHDEDGVFPDLSPLVTLVQCAMGAYPTWSEVTPSSSSLGHSLGLSDMSVGHRPHTRAAVRLRDHLCLHPHRGHAHSRRG